MYTLDDMLYVLNAHNCQPIFAHMPAGTIMIIWLMWKALSNVAELCHSFVERVPLKEMFKSLWIQFLFTVWLLRDVTFGQISASESGSTSSYVDPSLMLTSELTDLVRKVGPVSHVVHLSSAAGTDREPWPAGFNSEGTYLHCSGRVDCLIRWTWLLTHMKSSFLIVYVLLHNSVSIEGDCIHLQINLSAH